MFARRCARRLEASDSADRKALEAALADAGQDAPVIERAIASGAPVAAVAALAASWAGLEPYQRGIIRHPLGAVVPGRVEWHGVHVTQVDQTTCGSASMAIMLMMGDPCVAAWVVAGPRASWYLPPEARAAERAADAVGQRLHTVGQRWDALQYALQQRSTRRALGPFPWPRAYGTPPWRVDNVTRYAGVRFRGTMIDDAVADEVAALAVHARAALADGIPVPLYASGDSTRGLDTVIPRHVVLLVGVDGEAFLAYEPSSGAVHRLDLAPDGEKPLPALGHWNRVVWAVLPRMRVG